MSNTGRKTQATHIAAKFEKSKKGKFVDNAYAQLWAGNKEVYKDYFTDDFKLENPEFHLISPTKYLEGDFALETMSRLFRADGNSWSKIEDEVMWEVDAGDKYIRMVRWQGSEPYAAYGGFDYLPPDLSVTLKVIEVFFFRDGKICEQFSTMDHLGYYFDMAQGDIDKAADAIKNAKHWKEWRQRVLQSIVPVPEPGYFTTIVEE